MFHSGSQTLIDLWSALPDAGRIPARAAFQPLRLGALTPQLFSADRTDDSARLRLAGGWVERLHGEPLKKGRDWLTLWRGESRPLVAASVAQCLREARPVVLAADAAGLDGVLEIVIVPFRNATGAADRIVGLYQPVAASDRQAESVGLLGARLSVAVGANTRAPLTLAAIDGRRIA